MISTHDTTPLSIWWAYEVETVSEDVFRRRCQMVRLPFESLKRRLFDERHSAFGRLRWRTGIKSIRDLLTLSGLDEEKARPLISIYKETYDEKAKFLRVLGSNGHAPKKISDFTKVVLEYINRSTSIFSIQLLQDWLSLDPEFQGNNWDFRINFPGTMSERNWSLVMPFSLERMNRLPVNRTIQSMNRRSHRI